MLFTIGQTSGGFELFTFGNTEQHLATHVMSVGKGGWPWYVDEQAGIWFGGDDKNRKIQHFPFRGWDGAGKPIYDLQNPRQWDWPAGFTKIARVLYRPDTDTLFISGYTQDLPMASWGLIGSIMVRYDHWSTNQRIEKWRTQELPRDDERLHPKSIDLAGDYLFTVTTRKYRGKDACVLVWDQATGQVVGAMYPSPNVGGQSGWVDISHGIQAYKRENGQYMVIVEEDARAKNLLYLWKP
ncbi:MAG: hypothetical protein HC898_09505 [Phycisphaerales bacterium]|nr:hypothetical protein [Phycisphaerales bacterium]